MIHQDLSQPRAGSASAQLAFKLVVAVICSALNAQRLIADLPLVVPLLQSQGRTSGWWNTLPQTRRCGYRRSRFSQSGGCEMTESAIDRARSRWLLPDTHQIVFAGEDSGAEFNRARDLARLLMPKIIGPDGMVRAKTLKELEGILSASGVRYFSERPYGPPRGKMIFYRSGRLFVRVKTCGELPGKYRAGVPHLSVFLVNRANLNAEDLVKFENEFVKFSSTGLARQKSGNQTDPAKSPKLRLLGIDMNSWAGETHFDFPVSGCLSE